MNEHSEQAAVIDWAALLSNQYPALRNLFAIPNAGKRSIGAARYYQAEGLKAGVPDLFLAWPAAGYSGLFIEMKSVIGRTTDQQDIWLSRLSDAGYKAVMCRGADEAIAEIENYLVGLAD